MRSCSGGHDASCKELGSLLSLLQQWDNPVKLFVLLTNGFRTFWVPLYFPAIFTPCGWFVGLVLLGDAMLEGNS